MQSKHIKVKRNKILSCSLPNEFLATEVVTTEVEAGVAVAVVGDTVVAANMATVVTATDMAVVVVSASESEDSRATHIDCLLVADNETTLSSAIYANNCALYRH